MLLVYKNADGTQVEKKLGKEPISIGRSEEADVVVHDAKVSRLHCGIRYQEGEYFIKDLQSRNGTFVNNEQIRDMKLTLGDRIRVGSSIFTFTKELGKGTQTVLREVESEMDQGKGYSTLMREIVNSVNTTPMKSKSKKEK